MKTLKSLPKFAMSVTGSKKTNPCRIKSGVNIFKLKKNHFFQRIFKNISESSTKKSGLNMFYLIQSRSFISTHFIHLYQVSTMSILTSMQQEKEQFVCVPSSEKSPSRTSGHPSQQLIQE